MTTLKELPIPEIVKKQAPSVELIRVWHTGNSNYFCVSPNLFKDPAAWGLLLVDLANHIANAYEQSSGEDAKEVKKRIKQGLDAEWSSPTDYPMGGLS